MIQVPREQHVAALRLHVRGEWSVSEFEQLLSDLVTAYDRVAAFMLLGALVAEEHERAGQLERRKGEDEEPDIPWTTLLCGWNTYYESQRLHRVPAVPIHRVIDTVQLLTIRLQLDAIDVASPGWIQVLGSWNPIKVVADFISRWRRENTNRLAIERRAEVDRERIREEAATERSRIHADFAVGVLNSLPESARTAAAERIPEMTDYVIKESVTKLETIANDPRIVEAEVVPAGKALPKRRRRRRRP